MNLKNWSEILSLMNNFMKSLTSKVFDNFVVFVTKIQFILFQRFEFAKIEAFLVGLQIILMIPNGSL